MRKAFDANVPKLRPRLRAGAPAESAELPLDDGESGGAPSPRPPPPAAAGGEGVVQRSRASAPASERAAEHAGVVDRADGGEGVVQRSRASAPASERAARHADALDRVDGGEGPVRRGAAAPRATVPAGTNDVLDRKDRLEKIKRKVAEAARPVARPRAAPADPARAAESVLGLVRDLEEELVRAREREDELRADVDELRKELGRTVSDGRAAAERLASAEKELEEKRAVLGEMLGEMQALEDERDESVRRAQALASLDEERARLLEEVTRRAEEEARLRAEREAEVERLSEELRAGAQDGARLRAAVGELARERDRLAEEADRARKERDDLAAAKNALEQVHAALAQARARLG